MPGKLRHLTAWEDHHIVVNVWGRISRRREFRLLNRAVEEAVEDGITTIRASSVGCIEHGM